MSLEEVYREFIGLVEMEDDARKEKAMEDFFSKLRSLRVDEFNWAEDVFEGIHVKENGDKTALHWISIDDGEERKYSYSEFASEGNRLVNAIRDAGVGKGGYLYIMLPLIPEVWIGHYATVKGGFVGVPLANILKERDIEYRFKVCPPDAIIADEESAKIIDAVLESLGMEPKIKIVVGDREGWEPYDSLKGERKRCEGERTRADDPIFCFFT